MSAVQPIPEEAVEAAAKAIRAIYLRKKGEVGFQEAAEVALAAAFPLLRAQVEAELRSQIAGEIDAKAVLWVGMSDCARAKNDGLRAAARVARGEQ